MIENSTNSADKNPPVDKPKTEAEESGSAHMGATEEQVIPLTPPTEALEKLMDDSADSKPQQNADDGLTPG